MNELQKSTDKAFIKSSLVQFVNKYDFQGRDTYWLEKSRDFYKFWNSKIRNNEHNLEEGETDYLIRIIDDKAKGHGAKDEAIALIGIRQKRWRKAINDLKNKKDLQNIFDEIINTDSADELPRLIDNFLIANKNNKNGFNGEGANMINAFLFLKDPNNFLSVVSLKHRKWIIDAFDLGDPARGNTKGEQIINSNFDILKNFRIKYNIDFSPRSLSEFFYTPFGKCNDINVKQLWYKKNVKKKSIKSIYSELILRPFAVDPSSYSKTKREKAFGKSFLDTQKDNYDKGRAGEEFVIEQEKERLISEGCPELAKFVEDKSTTNCGYDILSRNRDGSRRYIEVKSTEGKRGGSFFIACNEIAASEKYKDQYYLYVVVCIKDKPKIKYYKSPNFLDNKIFKKEPISYHVSYSENI